MTDTLDELDRLVAAEVLSAGDDARRQLDLAYHLLDGAGLVLARASGGDRQSATNLLDSATIRLSDAITEHAKTVADAKRGGRP